MLRKSQYILSLVVGIVVFFVLFTLTYFYMNSQSSVTQKVEPVVLSDQEKSVSALSELKKPEVVIEPSTIVTLRLVDSKNKVVEKIKVDSSSLLGLNEKEIKSSFSDYEVTRFNEKEVVLTKRMDVNSSQEGNLYYLGIEEDNVCIYKKDDLNDVTKLNLMASDFSTKDYSLLLSGKITITENERENLIHKPSEIQKILQIYDAR